MKDITTRVLKSEIDRSSDDRFNAISKISPDGIMTLNMFGYVTYINPAFSKITGFSEKEIVGKHMLTIPTMKGRDMKPILRLLYFILICPICFIWMGLIMIQDIMFDCGEEQTFGFKIIDFIRRPIYNG